MSGDIDQLIDCLKTLQKAKYNTREDSLSSFAQADRVLEIIYDLIVEKAAITDEDKAIIGPLLENSLLYIEIDIKRVVLKYRRRLDTDIFRKRSALQFLIENFGDYPTNTPGKKFSEFHPKIKELIRIADDLISMWKDRKDPEDPDSDREEAEQLPASHTWWKA